VTAADWSLTVGGAVATPLRLGLEDLEAMPMHTVRVTLECAGNGRAQLTPRPVSQPWLTGAVGTAEWTGVPLAQLLRDAEVAAEAVDVVFTGADHGLERGVEQDYQRALPLREALAADVLVAVAMNGAPLPPQHGFPARLVVPGWYGMAHVKWLRDVSVLDRTFEGFQHTAYRLRQEAAEEGEPLTRIAPRALLQPPGFPDFMSRHRVVEAGRVVLTGRAWSGWGPVTRVEVSTDGGTTWADALLHATAGRWAWRAFELTWQAEPGEHLLRVRAHDASGRVQPGAPPWNRGGFANNADEGVPVTVLAR
jgi:DMSO/TMAO reductase YedYZ molybdopterin-dependent catalytic subunit